MLLGGLWAIYLLTLCPTVHWLDSSALTAAAWLLVGAHPPGEAGYALLTHPFTRLPVGDIPVRASLGSALCLAASGALLHRLIQRLLPPQALAYPPFPPWTRVALPLVLVLGPCLSWPLWIQGVRAEVYALSLLLTLAMFLAALEAGLWRPSPNNPLTDGPLTDGPLSDGPLSDGPPGDDPDSHGSKGARSETASPPRHAIDARWLALTALLGGLSLSVHPLLGGLAGLPLLGLLVMQRPSLPRVFPALLAGTLGYSTNLFLWCRALAEPGLGWGDGSTPAGLRDLLLARTFQQNFSPFTPTLLWHNLTLTLDVLLGTAGPLLLLLALAGGVQLLLVSTPRDGAETLRSHRTLALLLLGLLGFNLASIVFQNKVLPDNPDLHGYLQLTHLCLWLLAGQLVAGLALRAQAHARRLEPGAAFPVPAPPLSLHRILTGATLALLGLQALTNAALSFPAANRAHDELAHRHGLAALSGLPPGAWLVTSGNDTMFLVEYLQHIEGRRPDVQHLPRSLLSHPWYREKRLRASPSLQPAELLATRTAATLLPLTATHVIRLELREEDLAQAPLLCPAPAPGWGFYTLSQPQGEGSCPSLTGAEPLLGGLLRFPAVLRGPEALAVALQAHHLEARWLEANARPELSRPLLNALRQAFPSLELP